MRLVARALGVFVILCVLPATARAQVTLAGAVTDNTGAVLPGVTVEAASPALIEKVRTATTDGSGHYTFSNLAPGIYTTTEGDKTGWFQVSGSSEETLQTEQELLVQIRDLLAASRQ